MKHARLRPITARSVGLAALAAAAALALAPPAQARNVRLMESVADAVRRARVHDILGNLDLRFGAGSGRMAEVLRRDFSVTGEGSTQLHDVGQDDSVRPSDHDLCARAFEDAITKLAFAARDARATAIVGVVSAYQGKVFDDPDHFECHAGALKAVVSLRANFVRGPLDVPVLSPPMPMAPPPPAPEPLPPATSDAAPPPAPLFQPLPPVPSPSN